MFSKWAFRIQRPRSCWEVLIERIQRFERDVTLLVGEELKAEVNATGKAGSVEIETPSDGIFY